MNNYCICSICHDNFTDPITLICTHSFCYSCIYEAINHRSKCPICNYTFNSFGENQYIQCNILKKMSEDNRIEQQMPSESQKDILHLNINEYINDELNLIITKIEINTTKMKNTLQYKLNFPADFDLQLKVYILEQLRLKIVKFNYNIIVIDTQLIIQW